MGIACKFGGTSVASASQIEKVAEIIESHPGRRYIVVSAPGKRHADDQKVTDLLYLAQSTAKAGLLIDQVMERIESRFQDIIDDLGVNVDLKEDYDEIRAQLASQSEAYAASRGEYLNGKIIAAKLGATFVDPYDHIFLTRQQQLEEDKSYDALGQALEGKGRFVVPGFYGQGPNGEVLTFSRGGSDITGAIVARSIHAEVYENWTDVCGLLMADPRVVDDPRNIEEVSYTELRELSYMGAQVLHDEAIFPVRTMGIPVQIRNTNQPDHPGTRIVARVKHRVVPIVGLAGKEDFEIVYVSKTLMNKEVGFGRRLLEIFENRNISFEHLPSGIDSVSVVVSSQAMEGHRESIIEEIREQLRADEVKSFLGISLIAVVGAGMAYHPGIAATVCTALSDEGVNIRLIDQGASELNIIIAVENKDFRKAIRSIYGAFIKDAKEN